MDWLISAAHAQGAAPAQADPLSAFLPLILLMVIFYFLLIRPQQKRNKEHKAMLGQLAKGDELITSGGVAGKLVEIGDAFITLEVADNVRIKVQKHAVSNVLPKGSLKQL